MWGGGGGGHMIGNAHIPLMLICAAPACVTSESPGTCRLVTHEISPSPAVFTLIDSTLVLVGLSRSLVVILMLVSSGTTVSGIAPAIVCIHSIVLVMVTELGWVAEQPRVKVL